jgi:hypothetical protein
VENKIDLFEDAIKQLLQPESVTSGRRYVFCDRIYFVSLEKVLE